MSDREQDASSKLLIEEIEEDLKREQYAKLWKTYGNWVIGAAVAVVAIVAGYQGWQAWQSEQRSSDAAAFAAATALPPGDAAPALAQLSAQARTGYQDLAALRRAALLAETTDVQAAVAAYDAIAADNSVAELYRGLATLRSVMLQIGTGDPATLSSRLQILAASPWRHTALELQAVLAHQQGDVARARELYERLATDATTPAGLRSRAAEMLAAFTPATANEG